MDALAIWEDAIKATGWAVHDLVFEGFSPLRVELAPDRITVWLTADHYQMALEQVQEDIQTFELGDDELSYRLLNVRLGSPPLWVASVVD